METAELVTHQHPVDEIYLVQNPALGAILMWEFVKGYKRQSLGKPPALPLLFIVLPILLSEVLRTKIGTTNPSSGLRLFIGKFSKKQEAILTLQRRMLMLRPTSLSSLTIAIDCGLLQLDYTTALVDCTIKRYPHKNREKIRELGKFADKLGGWCGALTLQEVQAVLRIGF
ncbi:conserved protein of unknown function [Pseudomonas sp. JV551A1]|uniref:three component ABC system middle component n=1 Tax=Pseudomonas sp. JV551A1 TaxID=2078787 RepID=UPI00100C70AE|nr:three component ABC system middle component [Pseudomonas sp. JV551A1]SPO55774.1 conserved protein of unknown function [Pseudomonas sp. JV551A1]